MTNRTSLFWQLAPLALALALAPSLAADPQPAAPADSKKTTKKVVTIKTTDKGVVTAVSDDDDEGLPPSIYTTFPKIKGGYLGVSLMEMTPELRTFFGVPTEEGILVNRVEPNSPAFKAGIKVGDVISGIDGKKVDCALFLTNEVRSRKEGQTVAVEVWRDHKMQTLNATLVEKERAQVDLGEVLRLDSNGDKMLFNVDPKLLEKSVQSAIELQRKYAKKGDQAEFKRLLGIQEKAEQNEKKRQELEKRLQELEKKLQELEEKLQKRSAVESAPSRN